MGRKELYILIIIFIIMLNTIMAYGNQATGKEVKEIIEKSIPFRLITLQEKTDGSAIQEVEMTFMDGLLKICRLIRFFSILTDLRSVLTGIFTGNL